MFSDRFLMKGIYFLSLENTYLSNQLQLLVLFYKENTLKISEIVKIYF